MHVERLLHEAYREELWGAAYLINWGCSDDGFHDFCLGLIERGRRVFEGAVADPDSLADALPPDHFVIGEFLASRALVAWMEHTGQSEDDFYATLSRLEGPRGVLELKGEGWDFDDDAEMRRRLPRLSQMYPADEET